MHYYLQEEFLKHGGNGFSSPVKAKGLQAINPKPHTTGNIRIVE